jgi:murein L,D-transpeptidase YafK
MVRLARRYYEGNPPSAQLAACLIGVLGFIAVSIVAIGSGFADADAADSNTVLVTKPRVVVLKSKRILHLFDGDCLVRTYPIDLGTVPDGPKRRKDDQRTPVGRFRIVTKNPDSQYHRFLGIDYPDEAAVQWGLNNGLVSIGEARDIRRALEYGQCPNWMTGLGGGIGIHGHRIGRDWTGGCIALSDQHVEELFSVLRIGDPVEILP